MGDPTTIGARPADLRAKLVRRFQGQAGACSDLGSPLYAALLDRAAADLGAGGPVWDVCAPMADLPGGSLLSLRFMGATHRLALSGGAPDLARHYPSCGGDGDAASAWDALLGLCASSGAAVTALLDRGVQTNEVGRCAALLGGFLDVARRFDLPLRVREVGASAGLNLRWDHFRYTGWGPASSPVDQGDPWIGPARPVLAPASVTVVDRRGCDLAPIDPSSEEGRLTLLSFVWPDMSRRFRLLDAACRVAAEVSVAVDRADAATWITSQLADAVSGTATVVFHSIVLQYLPPDDRSRFIALVTDAGERATSDAPLAWLRFEPAGALGPSDVELRLTCWPGGEDVRLATCHPHGTWIRWDA